MNSIMISSTIFTITIIIITIIIVIVFNIISIIKIWWLTISNHYCRWGDYSID